MPIKRDIFVFGPVTILGISLMCPMAASANDDMTSLATGGYLNGLRTKTEMHMIDTDGDGMVSKVEWLAYQDKVFATLDKSQSKTVDEKAFLTPSAELRSLATGGYARGLQSKAMMHKIDTDGDGSVSRDEFIAYQTKVFDMMDVGKTGNIGLLDFIGKH